MITLIFAVLYRSADNDVHIARMRKPIGNRLIMLTTLSPAINVAHAKSRGCVDAF